MAPLPDTILSLLPRSLLSTRDVLPDPRSLSPMAVQNLQLAKRDASAQNPPGAGSVPADKFNNLGFQVLFAFIGIGMVVTALWFFFWAKNGGFKWQDNDWEDYKSTVLRRKGPDGKTLSNATKSTRLGGGSVVHGGSYGAESSVGYTDETGTSADFGEMRQVEEGHGAFGIRGGDAEKKKKKSRKHTNDLRDSDLRDYRGEKAARVGGLNRQADGVYTDYSNTGSDLGSNLSSKPLVKPAKNPKDQKKEAKEKEARARERMRQAKLIEKNAARTAAAEAKAKKEADKAQAKKDKADQKAQKKTRRPATETEATPSEPAMTEADMTEIDVTDFAASVAPAPVFSKPPGRAQRSSHRESRRAPPSAAYSFTTGDDTNTVYTGTYTDNRTAPSEAAESSYYSDYRPNADPAAFSRASRERSERRERHSHTHSQSQSQSRSRPTSQSPRKQHRTSRPAQSQAGVSDIFTQANGNVQGTIAYPCHIPGLSSAGSVGVSESVSQVGERSSKGRGGRDVMDGYRRGGVRAVGRRDSLSDSD
ncbi:hypothetical protein K491DRAFT_273300 [Lophiostoma macrostomum CBS 122681]|uniref:Uncharacterized protein n=1 Tax=Lophiostoma macrostomum CBS 122681 TaxID=1314788 RepID=A0A6A6SKD8_9PLEO|nr:hypothetical protein K491DRAFT_273300 [Lophiostoma macrostomum CBS 122681]